MSSSDGNICVVERIVSVFQTEGQVGNCLTDPTDIWKKDFCVPRSLRKPATECFANINILRYTADVKVR